MSEPLRPRWLFSAWNRIAHDLRRPARTGERPDYVKIAILEHEIFGIEPEPGTTAATVINLQRALGVPYAGRPGYRDEWRP